MFQRIITTLILPLLCMTFAIAQTLPTGNPLVGLEQLKSFETMRSSSSDANWQDGNGDARWIGPNSELTLCELEGPGMITHIWFTIAHGAANYSRLMTIRIYWDGEEHPSVESPIGDFFGVGHGVDKMFTSLPIRVASDGRARNCYWPMPFHKSAKVTVSNDTDQPCGALYWYIDWQKHDSLPADTAYFHAMYRQEFPCVMGRNFLLADIEGRGHYVGTVQSVYHVSNGWYGEGDDFFYIDGEKEPRLRGTGTEDYFCDAWGFRVLDGPYFGIPLWEGFGTGDRGSAYRFHIVDPIVFTKSLKAEIEHKGSQDFPNGENSGFIERDDLMSSVAFWYQTEPHKPWLEMPAGKDRLPCYDEAVLVGYRMIDQTRKTEHPLVLQDLGGVTDGKQLFFNPADDTGCIEIPFTVVKDITGPMLLKVINSWDYGVYRVLLDGRQVGQYDLYNANVLPTEYKLGVQTLTAGEHILRFECAGKNTQSKGYFLGFDALVMRLAVYSRPASVDLRTLQVK